MRRKNAFSIAVREFVYRHFGIRARQRKVLAGNATDTSLEHYLKSHVCLKPFENLETTNRGLAHVCCPDWLPTPIANMDGDLLSQWAGPMAQRIRKSIVDGTYEI